MDRNIQLIIKVTNSCNMSCKYCYIEPEVFHKQMEPATARRVVRTFLDSDYFKRVSFVWHGGEPLLRGRAFFEEVLAEQRTLPTKVKFENSIQTNATLLDDNILEFLVSNTFHIGMSMDGPSALSNLTRPYRSTGKREDSPANAVLSTAQKLHSRKIAAGAIVVVSASNIDYPEEIYRSYRAENIHMKITPLMNCGHSVENGVVELGITARQYGEFMIRLFDTWYDDRETTISIDPFSRLLTQMLGYPKVPCSCVFSRDCHHSFIGIAPDGEMFPCGLFQGETQFRYGNIADLRPEDIPNTAVFKSLEDREKKILADCAGCAFYTLCFGGCMFNSLKNAQHFYEKDYYCESYRMYFSHLLERLHADLSFAAQRMKQVTPPPGE